MVEMWRGSKCQKSGSPQVSFEFFPPKTDALSASLWSAFQELLQFKPVFVSVTYGVGGTTRNSTHEIVERIRRETDVVPAAYPEQHPESRGIQSDMDYLKRKCDVGAVRFIAQFFFDNDCFFRFCGSVQEAGITVPIVPGILPIANFEQTARFSANCGVTIPTALENIFETASDDPGEVQKVALNIAGEQCLKLVSSGVGQLHFYTLNRADLVSAICRVLGIIVCSAAEPISVVRS